jgi:STE24 endopeptidase
MEFLSQYPYYKQKGWSASSSNDFPYLFLTLLFTGFVFFIEHYLEIRQLLLFQSSKTVPKELKGSIPEETFTKSLSYGIDSFRFRLVEGFVGFAEGIILVLAGYLPFAWDLAESLSLKYSLIAFRDISSIYQEMIITSVFIIILTVHDTIFGLPFQLYKTFVVEQKHGFNNSTLGLFLKDKLVTFALSMALGAPVISVVVWLVRWGGEYFYFYVWVFLFIVSMVMMTIYPTVIAPLFNKYEKLESGPVFDDVEALAKRVSFPLTQLFVVDGSKRSAHSNAYFY